jgi:hypothetical protein
MANQTHLELGFSFWRWDFHFGAGLIIYVLAFAFFRWLFHLSAWFLF